MEFPEPKPALQTIQFPESSRRPGQREPAVNGLTAPADSRLLTPQEVANRLGVSERWVRDHASRRSPRIPAVRLGPLVRFRSSDIEDFLNQNTFPAPSKKRLSGV